jgi:pimeloyl-ACP methyl ester carboxylesterase
MKAEKESNSGDFTDPELKKFEASGAAPLPSSNASGYVSNEGAEIWYSSFGAGPPVILLHGGLGHSGNWGYQVPALLENGYRTVVIDTRGHGRSTRDSQPYAYELLASDVLSVLNHLQIQKTASVGWSDGACTSLVLAKTAPARVAGVFYFACNMNPGGAKDPFDQSPLLDRCISRHIKDYSQLSPTPDQFETLMGDLGLMQRTQPDYSIADLTAINVPVVVAQAEHDEFIRREHAEYLSRTIPNARYEFLAGVSHFAPLQKPRQFNTTVLNFIKDLSRRGDLN